MNRRGFLGTVLALGAAPAIVRAESLMKIWVPEIDVEIVTVDLFYPDHAHLMRMANFVEMPTLMPDALTRMTAGQILYKTIVRVSGIQLDEGEFSTSDAGVLTINSNLIQKT